MTTRRDFMRWSAASGTVAVAGRGLWNGTAGAATPVIHPRRGRPLIRRAPVRVASAAGGLQPYVDPMPLLVDNVIDGTGSAPVRITTGVVSRKVHRDLPATTLFGYLHTGGPAAGDTAASYLGPIILARRGTQVRTNYTNGLAPTDYQQVFTNGGSSYLQFPPLPEARNLVHLHGGFTAGIDDGNPFSQPNGFGHGGTQSVTYPNEQRASLLWYHDHYMGDTRMNVVAGLAGGYLLRDGFDTGGNPLLPGPVGRYELPLVIQDRQFNPDGSLLYPVAPAGPAGTNGPWISEYFGDAMLVNGTVWPFLNVEPAVYRFRVLNGCNARIMNLSIFSAAGPTPVPMPMTVIGTEGGLLPVNPAPVTSLVMAPAERYDVICDFRGFAGTSVFLQNSDPLLPVSTPAPSLAPVMQINVNATAPSGAPTRVPGAGSLPADPELKSLTDLGPPLLSGGWVQGRMITLNEVGASLPAWKLNVNAHPYGGPSPITERLIWQDVEDWYYVNTTPDTHPMHTHLFTFHVMGRYNFNASAYAAAYGGPNGVPQLNISTLAPFLTSKLLPPDPTEAGFKDTVKANPGQVTVIRARYNVPSTALDAAGQLVSAQRYVHHCHIVEHEDNDMMERFMVTT